VKIPGEVIQTSLTGDEENALRVSAQITQTSRAITSSAQKG